MRRPYILCSGNKVLDAHWKQSAKRNLVRERSHIYVVGSSGRRMQIEPVAANAYRVEEGFRANLGGGKPRRIHPLLSTDMRFCNRELRFDATRFADIRILG